MKLVHQINLVFGLSLLLIFTVTAIIVHYVLLDHLIVTQKDQLKTLGAAMSATFAKEDDVNFSIKKMDTFPAAQNEDSNLYEGTEVQAIVSDEYGNIITKGISSSLPISFSLSPYESTSSSFLEMEVLDMKEASASTFNLQEIWKGQDQNYVSEVSVIPQGTLTLLTPMSKIKAIEQALLGRLVLILFIVGLAMFLISWFVTKKLIQPLIHLRQELKKVKERRFTEVKLVEAGGEIGTVAQSVFEMAEELNRFNQVQKHFFQNASHELKTPVMSISGYAEGILDGIFEGESIRKGLDIIIHESKRLGNIVTEMTLLAKLDSEEDIFRPSMVSLKELLMETVERANPLLVKKEIELHLDCPDHAELLINADQDKLLQALLNVIMNAVRYARKNIYVTASLSRGSVMLQVKDDGPGIPQELMSTLFHRFVKGKDGESGLGLAISRAIVERCGGLIKAGNNAEGGANITFAFPSR